MRGNRLPEGKQRVLIDIDRDLLRRIDHIAVDWDAYRKDAIIQLLEIGVEEVNRKGVEETAPA
jgi:hypothetical protein